MIDATIFENMNSNEVQAYLRQHKDGLAEEDRLVIFRTWQAKRAEEKQAKLVQHTLRERAELPPERVLESTTSDSPSPAVQKLYADIEQLQGAYHSKLTVSMMPVLFWKWMIAETGHTSIALEQPKTTQEDEREFVRLFYQQRTNFQSAFEYVLQQSMTEKVLTEDIIIGTVDRLLKNVEPEHRHGYRTVSVQLKDLGIAPCNPASISSKMAAMLKEIEEGNKSPIQKALDIHYNMIFMQPFIDANKRTSRMIASFYLMQHDYPPIIIPPKDQSEYLDVLVRLKKTGDRVPYETFMLTHLKRTLELSIERLNELPFRVFDTVKLRKSNHASGPNTSSGNNASFGNVIEARLLKDVKRMVLPTKDRTADILKRKKGNEPHTRN